MAVKEQDVELIVRQILDQMSGSTRCSTGLRHPEPEFLLPHMCSYAY